MCWEDVEMDRKLLEIDPNSQIVMITSAGCNALTYLLDNPKVVHSVDINPRQTALLDLKINVLRYGSYRDFKELFWDGSSAEFLSVYEIIKSHLLPSSRDFWDDNIHYFDPKGGGLFLQGGAGMFARFLRRILDKKGLTKAVIVLSEENDIHRRELLFTEIEHQLWNGMEQWIWRSKSVLSLAGIPASQRTAIGDMNGFMKSVLYSIFVQQRAAENPYWGRYLGLPSLDVPKLEYLSEYNADRIRSGLDRIEFETSSLNDFLSTSSVSYTHFVLLDHMDWLVGTQEVELTRLWKLLIRRSAPNSRILFRTAFSDLSFIPPEAFLHFEFKKIDSSWIKKHDRVGTYPGTYLAISK